MGCTLSRFRDHIDWRVALSDQDHILRIVSKYWESGSLFAASDLGLFSILVQGPRTLREISRHMGVSAVRANLILRILMSMGLVEKDETLYRLSKSAGDFFAPSEGGSYVIHHYLRGWRNWGNIAKKLQEKELEADAMSCEELFNYVMKMTYIAKYVAPCVIDSVDLTGKSKLLDVGGGAGSYSIAFAHKYKDIEITLLDRRYVAQIAARRIFQASMQERISVVAGDIFWFPVRKKYDVILLANFLHLYPPNRVRKILETARQSLMRNGQILIVDYLPPSQGSATLALLLFSLHIMIHTQGGRCYSQKELSGLCEAEGLDIRLIRKLRVCGLEPLDERHPTLMVATRSDES